MLHHRGHFAVYDIDNHNICGVVKLVHSMPVTRADFASNYALHCIQDVDAVMSRYATPHASIKEKQQKIIYLKWAPVNETEKKEKSYGKDKKKVESQSQPVSQHSLHPLRIDSRVQRFLRLQWTQTM